MLAHHARRHEEAARLSVVRTMPRRAGSPAELTLAGLALLAVIATAVPTLAVAAAFVGTPGVLGAAVGLALVLVLFGAAALLHAWAARFPPETQVLIIGTGVATRLGLYTVVLLALSGVEGLHLPSLALATFAGIVVTMAVELWAMARQRMPLEVQRDNDVEG